MSWPRSSSCAATDWQERADVIRERLPILSVVAPHVKLEKHGNALQGLCPMPNHLEATPSFTLYPSGGTKVKVGFFVCYGCGAKGDVIHFVMQRQRLSWTDAIRLLESENGLQLLKASAAPRKPAVRQAHMDGGKVEKARKIWERSIPLGPGGAVDLYLRARALVPPAEYGVGGDANAGWPVDLRFMERCWHDLERREFPAMVAAIRDYAGELLTVHRTYLARSKQGMWTKAPVAKAKLVVGPWPPGFIRLGDDCDTMLGGEGIETTLSAMQLWKRPGICFVNSSRMHTVEPPFGCTDFIYAADKGGKGRWGEHRATEGAQSFRLGRQVVVKVPSLAADKGDFNDLLMLRARSESQAATSAGDAHD